MEERFPSHNVTDHTSESLSQLSAIQIIEIVLYFTISVIGTTANIMVFYTLLGRHYLRVTEYLILNLALTDLATCAVSITFDLTERLLGGFPFGSIMCSVVYPLQTILMAVSVITLLFISLERRHMVMKPFLLPRVHPIKAKIAIFVSWIVPILFIIPHALVLRLDGDQCLEMWPEHWHVQIFTLTNFTFFFAIPMVVIATSYFMAGRRVRMELAKLNDMLEGTNRSKRDFIRKRTIQKLKVTKMFIIVVFSFFVCMLPTHLVWIWHDFAQGQQNAHFEYALVFSNILMYLNSALNPFIFRTVQGKSFTRLVACCWKKFCENSNESRISPNCVYTHYQMSQIEGERVIRVTKQTSSKSSCRFEMRDETRV